MTDTPAGTTQNYLCKKLRQKPMKDTTIFALLLLVIAASALLGTRNRSRKATIKGTFAAEIGGVNYQWTYLRRNADDAVLDSCLILDNRFTLSGEIPDADFPCRVVSPKLGMDTPLQLNPQQVIALNISAEDYREQMEEALEEAIARLDEHGVSLPDSVWKRDSLHRKELPERPAGNPHARIGNSE